MLLILAMLYVFHSNTSAAPISHILRDVIPPDLNGQCICPNQQRSVWDILWSCLATIFACTWVSVHPNVPLLGEKWWKTGLHRVELMVWALIAPEMIIYWAMRQWYGARAMVGKYYGHGWTKTHAYFIQMGGFALFEGGRVQDVLLPEEMESLLLQGRIDLPQITEEEIRDRSKGDGLSKALVLGQTSWFVAQCLARRAQGLIITELELVTGAFAVLNGVMYVLWWNKPLDVRCPVPVQLLDRPKPVEERFQFKSMKKPAITIWDAIFFLNGILKTALNIPGLLVKLIRKAINAVQSNMLLEMVIIIILSPWTAIRILCSRLDDIYAPAAPLKVAGSVSTASTFYASDSYTSGMVRMVMVPSVTAAIGALFGGLHCAGWFFTFPSPAESIIWRVCSALTSIIPLSVLIFFIASFSAGQVDANSISKKLSGVPMIPTALLEIVLPIYVVARLLLLGEAFAALRYLPPDALAVVDWVSFLPHI